MRSWHSSTVTGVIAVVLSLSLLWLLFLLLSCTSVIMKDTESVLVQTNIDRRTCLRVKPMQVLVLGLCRTGTLCKCATSSSAIARLLSHPRATLSPPDQH